jgi:hypothetical protein
MEMPESQLIRFINSHDGDEISDEDLVVSEYGEIALEAGQPYKMSYLHKDYQRSSRRSAPIKGYEFDDDDFEDEPEEEENEYERADKEFRATVADFAEGFVSEFTEDDPADIAYDGADGFFWNYPQWKTWASALRMSKAEMKEAVADMIYDAMTKNRKTESKKISVVDLKKILKEELRLAQMTNMRTQKEKVPTSFQDFRLFVANVLEAAEGPQDVIDDVRDLDYEGLDIQPVMDFWSDLEDERRNDPELWQEVQREGLLKVHHDDLHRLILDLVKDKVPDDQAYAIAGQIEDAVRFVQ